MANGSLFDLIPLSGDPGRYTESEFSFLSRADGPAWQRVRDLLEDWYTVHPDRNGGLRARFREHDIRQHAPAWWELYTYTLFRRLGYEVAVDPDVPKGKADLLVTGLDSAMYVECVVLFKDGSRPTLDGQKWLCDCIDAANKPDFHVGIRGTHGHGSRPKKREITKRIEDWLGSLDYDSIRAGRTGRPSEEFEFGEWRVSLSAVPVSPDRRGMAGGHFGPPSGAYVVSSVEGIRELLVEKAYQCRGVDDPLYRRGTQPDGIRLTRPGGSSHLRDRSHLQTPRHGLHPNRAGEGDRWLLAAGTTATRRQNLGGDVWRAPPPDANNRRTANTVVEPVGQQAIARAAALSNACHARHRGSIPPDGSDCLPPKPYLTCLRTGRASRRSLGVTPISLASPKCVRSTPVMRSSPGCRPAASGVGTRSPGCYFVALGGDEQYDEAVAAWRHQVERVQLEPL